MRTAPGDADPGDTVVVRWLPVDGVEEAVVRGAARLLDDAEGARAARFHFDRDRRAYVLAHALLRVMLSRDTAAAPASWRFVSGAHGKPEIAPSAGGPRQRFNLSHTRGLVAVAVTEGLDVGIDVEKVDPRRLGPEVTDRFFAPPEVDHLRSLAGAGRTEAAYAYWTLKESYIKAIGLGLSCPLDAFHFELEPLGIRFSDRLDDDPARWFLRRLRPTPDHALAVMARHDRPSRLRLDARPAHIDDLTREGQPDAGSGRI